MMGSFLSTRARQHSSVPIDYAETRKMMSAAVSCCPNPGKARDARAQRDGGSQCCGYNAMMYPLRPKDRAIYSPRTKREM